MIIIGQPFYTEGKNNRPKCEAETTYIWPSVAKLDNILESIKIFL